MPPAKRRKIAPKPDQEPGSPQENGPEKNTEPDNPQEPDDVSHTKIPVPAVFESSARDKNKERQERFKALQARAVSKVLNNTTIRRILN